MVHLFSIGLLTISLVTGDGQPADLRTKYWQPTRNYYEQGFTQITAPQLVGAASGKNLVVTCPPDDKTVCMILSKPTWLC
jgi:hypothetical protein